MNFVDIVHSEYTKSSQSFYFSKNIPTIRKISNVRVRTEICFEKTGPNWNIYLEIKSSNITNDDDYKIVLFKKDLRRCSSEVTRKDIKVSLERMKKIIPNLKFSKLLGKIDSDKAKSFEQICLNEFGPNFIESNECCVCNESTITKTNCSHFLCVECWSQIRSNQCPMCRQNNIFINESDSCSDDDGDDGDDDDETEYTDI